MLGRLARKGLIARVRRGLYLVPPKLPLGGKWSPGEFLALKTLIGDKDGKFQICGPNAFQRHGWSTQISNRLFVYNNRLSGDRTIGAVRLTLIKVMDKRLGLTDRITTPDGLECPVSSRIRTLIDAVYDWKRFNSLPRAYDWIRDELRDDETAAYRLVDAAIAFGNQATLRRLGKLLEMEDCPPGLLKRIKKRLKSSTSSIPWVPNLPKRGVFDREWGVVMNAATNRER